MHRRRITKEQIHRGVRDAVALQCSDGGAPPTEIRIWKVGVNTDLNGYNVLWDAKAARQVMAAYKKHGVRLSWDLEHLSLDDTHPNFDPDARASCELELRNGELWATNIQWTADAAERITSGRQRYPSPAFYADKDGRPTRVINIALCARPATDCIEPLAAKEAPMKITRKLLIEVSALAHAMLKGGASPARVIKTLAEGDGGDTGGSVAGVDIAALADFLAIDVDPAQDPAGFVKALLAKMEEITGKLRGDAPAAPAAPDAPTDAGASADMPPEEKAAAKLMLKMIGCDTFVAGALRMSEHRTIIAAHETEVEKVKKEAAAIERTERTALVVRLQTCGAETPATSGLTDGKLVKRLAEEPIDALRDRVGQLELAKGIKQPAGAGGPGAKLRPGAGGDTHGLTEVELAMCERRKIEPAAFAAKFKAPKGAQVGG